MSDNEKEYFEDIDFSQYGDDDNEDTRKPLDHVTKFSTIRSRWNDSKRFLESLADIRDSMIKRSSRIHNGTADINTFKEHYGHCANMWYEIKAFEGKVNVDKIDKILRAYKFLIKDFEINGKKDERIDKVSVKLQELLNKICLWRGLTIEYDFGNRGGQALEMIQNS